MDELDRFRAELREDMAALKKELREDMASFKADTSDANSRVLAEVGEMRLLQLHNAELITGLHGAIVGNGTTGLGDQVKALRADFSDLNLLEVREHGGIRVLLVFIAGMGTLALAYLKNYFDKLG